MSTAKQKGTAFETQLVRGFRPFFGADLDRHVLHGAEDEGDIWLPWRSGKFVIEAKNYRSPRLAVWADELAAELGNADKRVMTTGGAVIFKKPGSGSFLEQNVMVPWWLFHSAFQRGVGHSAGEWRRKRRRGSPPISDFVLGTVGDLLTEMRMR